MVHQSRGFKTLKDVFTHPGTLQAEDNAWLHFLEKRFGTPVVKITLYSGGISQFLAQKDCSQQCFVTSEPILAKKAASDPQTFLISDEGYNPYTTVVICQSSLLKSNPAEVKAMAAACRAGWQAYLTDPSKANAVMHAANSDMDADTFTAGAAAQKSFILPAGMNPDQLGTMTADRWNTLSNELVELGVLDNSMMTPECFVNP
jgi:NitT/TauT family transport system substrate-binding protein